MKCMRIDFGKGSTMFACGSGSRRGIRWPATADELNAAGYAATGQTKKCNCGPLILWFLAPSKKWIPLSSVGEAPYEPHHAACSRGKDFRAAKPESTPGELFE